MNAVCIICGDLLVSTDDIYSTKCGHIFHNVCLLQWIERSKTCPQCRCRSSENTIHRLYFSLPNTEKLSEDPTTLQFQLDNLNFQITLKEKQMKNAIGKCNEVKNQNQLLRDEVRELEQKQGSANSTIHALKEQIRHMKDKVKGLECLKTEIVDLRKQLSDVEHIQLIIDGTKDQVNDMLRNNNDTRSLCILVSTLKKELIETDRRYKSTLKNLKHIENEVSHYQKRIDGLMLENTKLIEENACHKSCEEEKQHLKQIIGDMDKKCNSEANNVTSSSNISIQRIIMESPAPSQKSSSKTCLPNPTFDVESVPASDNPKASQSTNSPYLSLKSSSIGFSHLMNPKFTTNQTSLRKTKTSQNLLNGWSGPVSSKMNYNYDGLGGHSKTEMFPQPQPKTGIKRRLVTKMSTTSKIGGYTLYKKVKSAKDFVANTEN